MFVVQPDPDRPRGRVLVDESRGALVRKTAGHGRLPGLAMVLIWRGKEIPFDMYQSEQEDPVTGETFVLNRFGGGVGRSSSAELAGVVPSPITADEQHEAEVVAAEAMIVFGRGFDGARMPDGAVRVQIRDRIFRRSDFS